MTNRGFKQILPPVTKADFYDENDVPAVADNSGGYLIDIGDTGGRQTFDVVSDGFVSDDAVALLVAGFISIGKISDKSNSQENDRISVGNTVDSVLQTLCHYTFIHFVSPSPGTKLFISKDLVNAIWIPIRTGVFDYSISIETGGVGEISIKAEIAGLE